MNPENRIDYVLTSDPFTLLIAGGLLFLLLILILDAAFKKK